MVSHIDPDLNPRPSAQREALVTIGRIICDLARSHAPWTIELGGDQRFPTILVLGTLPKTTAARLRRAGLTRGVRVIVERTEP